MTGLGNTTIALLLAAHMLGALVHRENFEPSGQQRPAAAVTTKG